MTRRLLPFLSIAVLAMMTLPVWAKPNSSEALKATVNLTETTTLNNTTLTPGQYKVTAEGNQATFERDGKIVAQIPCTWKTLPNKSEYSAVLTDHHRVLEIDFSGKTQAIEFSPNHSAGN